MYIICVYTYVYYIYVCIYIYTYTHPIYISFTSHKSLISHQTLLFSSKKFGPFPRRSEAIWSPMSSLQPCGSCPPVARGRRRRWRSSGDLWISTVTRWGTLHGTLRFFWEKYGESLEVVESLSFGCYKWKVTAYLYLCLCIYLYLYLYLYLYIYIFVNCQKLDFGWRWLGDNLWDTLEDIKQYLGDHFGRSIGRWEIYYEDQNFLGWEIVGRCIMKIIKIIVIGSKFGNNCEIVGNFQEFGEPTKKGV